MQVSDSTLSPIMPYSRSSKEEAHAQFWGLGDRFWMQIIDGKYHTFGPMVFDENLHGNYKEPGFFASLKDGCDFAASHLTEKVSLTFYKELHRKMCAHFKGRENGTNMLASEAGICTGSTHCRMSIRKMYEEGNKHYEIVYMYQSYAYNLQRLREFCPDNYQLIVDGYPESKRWVTEKENFWAKKVVEVNSFATTACDRLGIPKIVSVSLVQDMIYIDYHIRESHEIERIIEHLFDNYNRKIESGDKIELIAELYQMLEWLHPFNDGQGRTDLVLLAKLLSEQGLHPAILHEPYTSSWSTLAEWKNDLLNGLELWAQSREFRGI